MSSSQWLNEGGWVLLGLGLVILALAIGLARVLFQQRERDRRNDARIDELRRELTGLEQGRDDLERLSAIDPVTGVWNYRYLQQSLARELSRAARDRRPFALLLCELDGFTGYTEEHGHQRAIGTLRELAQRLSVEIRAKDTFARYGGDEFVVLLPGATGEGAAGVAERLCYAVRRRPNSAAEAATRADDGSESQGSSQGSPAAASAGNGRFTLSVGIACYPESGEHAASLVGAADKALAAARSGGGDGWRLAGETEGSNGTPSADTGPLPEYQPRSRS